MENNWAAYDGGTLYAKSCKRFDVSNSSFFGSTASSGGAVQLTDTSATIADSLFSRNRAIENGGAFVIESKATLSIMDSMFTDNSAFLGGVADIDASQMVMTNCEFHGETFHSSEFLFSNSCLQCHQVIARKVKKL